MSKTWSDEAAHYLVNSSSCPRCDSTAVELGRCGNCGVDLTGPLGAELWHASARAAEAITLRQALVDRLPQASSVPAVVPAVAAAGFPASLPSAPESSPSLPSPEGSSSQISVQSVLAVTGAALFAVAAIVFTFFNPDLTNFGTRTGIVAAITVVFLGGAWLLARAKLQFSAESVGALGMVFVVLDVWAFSQASPAGINGWVYAAFGALSCSAAMILLGSWTRIRTWLWAGLTGVAITPALLGYASDNPWVIAVGHVAAGFAALAVRAALGRFEARFGARLGADRGTAAGIRMLVVIVVLTSLPVLAPPGETGPAAIGRALGAAALVGILAVLSALSARNELTRFWSYLTGALAVGAISVLAFAVPLAANDSLWLLALIPFAGAVALTVLSFVTPPPAVDRALLHLGGWSAALLGAVPVTVIALAQLPTASVQLVPSDFGLVAFLGLCCAAGGTWMLSRAIERTSRTVRPAGATRSARADGILATGLWLGMLALFTIAGWSALLPVSKVLIGLGSAIGLSILLVRMRTVAAWPARLRAPLVVAAHLLLFFVAVAAWTEPVITVAAGAAVVGVLVMVARTVGPRGRPVHVAAGFAYALFVFATGLGFVNLDVIAILCLTTSLASVCALAATLVHRIGARSWYAVLIVTAIPFLIGIVSVLLVRSGWTALSTGVTFALALTLLLTRRPGLNRVVRTAAAALLVPALAVVVVCLGAQLLVSSGSPVTLPIIAIIVSVALPATGFMRSALVRHGLTPEDSRAARLWIELSSLVTAAIAVLLAIVRAAAGLQTTFLVLVILGFGAAATAIIARRRVAWVFAAASWTGALWCVWALAGVDVLEPYVLPPALAAAVVGAVLMVRGRPIRGLYPLGLAFATAPSLVVLACFGNGNGSVLPWRALGLLAGAVLLLAVSILAQQLPAESRLRALDRLQLPTLFAAMGAAAGGTVQAVRYGWSLDQTRVDDPALLMLPVLGFSVAAAVVAIAAARRLETTSRPAHDRPVSAARIRIGRSRGLYVPAALYLALGPMAAVRPGWFPIATLWVLTAVLLATMLVTTERARIRPVTLPPVWFLFALAWCTAVAGWSERELRVEAFSLPLGLALVASGVIAMRGSALPARPGLTSWPNGFGGSWRLLTPGIVATLLPSMLATGTDPLTWRAILVIALALVAILVGSLRKLGAPFILGIIVLPIENIVVFVVQLGRSIGAAPWWITLATAGAVLLVIAVTYERRVSGSRGVTARLRDLR